MGRVVIPYSPREHFKPFHNRDERFACIVAHRRAGKTVACINELIKGAITLKQKDPRFAYIAPQYNQAKDVAWNYLKEYTAPVPNVQWNESELRVDMPNGGRIRLYGAENYDRLRGLYLDGVILDEYATMDPRIWEVVRPALSDRQGWCVWIGTPAGHNAFYDVWQKAQEHKDYFALMLKASETGIIPESELEAAKADLSVDQYEQEYECSFEAAVQGAYYGADMKQAEAEDRIRTVPWERDIPVKTAWDLGIGDSTAIWFAQMVNNEIRFIDYIENSGVGLDWYAREIKSRPYIYDQHICPHDVEHKELGTGKSRKETLESLGLVVDVAPKIPVDDGINAVRKILNRCWFDRDKCQQGIEALKQYRTEYDDKLKTYKNRPLHDWASHGADAMRYFAVGHSENNEAWDADMVSNILEIAWKGVA
jgi:phage terminase large subunit